MASVTPEKPPPAEGENVPKPPPPPPIPPRAPTPLIDPVKIIEDGFGFIRSEGSYKPIRRYTWTNDKRMLVQVITYGATITAIKVPDRFGVMEDILFGYDDIYGYVNEDHPYFGALCGRLNDKTANASFDLNGRLYEIDANWINKHHLNGGFIGFDKVIWDSYIDGNKVIMTHLSKDGSAGYPGNLFVVVKFQMTHDNNFIVNFYARCDKPTHINLSMHPYFNLAGHGTGHKELYKHLVSINAEKVCLVYVDGTAKGKFRGVKGTVYDLRVPRGLGGALRKVSGGGYDHTFVVTKGSEQKLSIVARVLHPNSGRILELYSDQPGVRFFTGNFFPDPDDVIRPVDMYYDDFWLQNVVFDTQLDIDTEFDDADRYFMTDEDGFMSRKLKDSENSLRSCSNSSSSKRSSSSKESKKSTISIKKSSSSSKKSSAGSLKQIPELTICEPSCECKIRECGFKDLEESVEKLPSDMSTDKTETENAEENNITSSSTLSEQLIDKSTQIGPSLEAYSKELSQITEESQEETQEIKTEEATLKKEPSSDVCIPMNRIGERRNCDAHKFDVCEQEMPDWGPTTYRWPEYSEIRGKMGARYRKHGGFCFNTQKYPDAVHHCNLRTTLLNPGETYRHRTVYRFGIQFGREECLIPKVKAKETGMASLSM